jgi:uncharacterized membrane protein
MSKTTRWILGIVLILLGLATATFFAFGGAFATVGCRQAPPDWAYGIVLAAGMTFLVAAAVPAVMLMRGAAGKRVVVALALGGVLSCILYVAAFALGMAPYC